MTANQDYRDGPRVKIVMYAFRMEEPTDPDDNAFYFTGSDWSGDDVDELGVFAHDREIVSIEYLDDEPTPPKTSVTHRTLDWPR